MALDFPNAPALGQVFSAAHKLWSWDGEKWLAYGATSNEINVSGSTDLPLGFNGSVWVYAKSSTITIKLPPSPISEQGVFIKDVVGDATAHPIIVDGNGLYIEDNPTITIMYDYGWVDLFFTGDRWVQR